MKQSSIVALVTMAFLLAAIVLISGPVPSAQAAPQLTVTMQRATITNTQQAVVAPQLVSLSQQVPMTLTFTLPGDTSQTYLLPIVLDVEFTISIGSSISATVSTGETSGGIVEAVTPTATPVAIPTEVVIEEAIDLSGAVLTLDQLQDGFVEMTVEELSEELSLEVGQPFDGEFWIESAFGFILDEDVDFEVVAGFTTLIPDELARAEFDVYLDTPFVLADLILGGVVDMDEVIIYDEDLLELFYDDIGDAVTGYYVQFDVEDASLYMDMVVFRRGQVGAVVLTFYRADENPVIFVDDAAVALDDVIFGLLSPEGTALLPEGDGEEETAGEAANLANLQSYRNGTVITMDGVQANDEDYAGVIEFTNEINREQNAGRVSISISGSDTLVGEAEGFTDIEAVRIGDGMWVKIEEDWIDASGESSGSFFDFDDFSIGVDDFVADMTLLEPVPADEVEIVNGVAADHYRFDVSALGDDVLADIGAVDTFQGDLWLSEEYGVVIRLVIIVEGQDITVGDVPFDGSMELVYDLWDINQPVTIEKPDTTGGTPLPGFEVQSFPMPDDAEVQMLAFGMLMYQTETPVEDLLTFYEEELVALGWEFEEEPTSFGGFASFTMVTEDYLLTAVMAPDEESGKISVTAFSEAR